MNNIYTLQYFLFFLLSASLIIAALAMILHRQIVKSTIFMIFFFILSTIMFVFLGSGFIATFEMLSYLIPVGIVAFLSVTILSTHDMLKEKFTSNWLRVILSLLVVIIFICQILAFVKINFLTNDGITKPLNLTIINDSEIISSFILDYYLLVNLSAIFLFIAVIGIVLLIDRQNKEVK